MDHHWAGPHKFLSYAFTGESMTKTASQEVCAYLVVQPWCSCPSDFS